MFVLLPFLLLYLGQGPAVVTSTLDYMSGAIPIREPDNRYPIMYSSIVPLLYKFHVPNWDDLSMKIQFWQQHNNCTKDDKYSSGYPCPVLYHMHPITDEFRENMTSWTNLFMNSDESLSSAGGFLSDLSVPWDSRVCNNLRMEPHFRGMMKTDSRQLKEYVRVMTQCAQLNGTAINLKTVNMTGIASYIEDMYHTTFASFAADYWPKLTGTNKEAISLVAWSALQTGLMAHQNMEAQRWNQAVETCKNSRIPWSLITGDSLREQLTALRSYLVTRSEDLAIPDEDAQKYFQLPLTDCIFGDDNTFLVRILVPVVPKDAAHKNYFVKYHPVPFTASGKICTLWEEEDSVSFNSGLNGVLPCTCSKSDIFCQGWKDDSCTAFHRHEERCIHAISADIEADIVHECPIKCRHPRQNIRSQRIIHQSDTTVIKIISAMPESGKIPLISCPSEKMTFKMADVGAYEITHPNSCSFNFVSKNSSVVKNVKDHIDLVQVDYIMPYHWREGVIMEDDDEGEVEVTLADQLDMLRGVEPKVNLLANRIEDVDLYCRDALNPTWVSIFVILSMLMNLVLAVIVGHLFFWKTKQVHDQNRLTLLSNAVDFPISDET